MTKKIPLAYIQVPANVQDGYRVAHTANGFEAISSTDSIFKAPVPTMQGETYGYKIGGTYRPTSPYLPSDAIKFSFANEATQTNIGDTPLLGPESRTAGASIGVSGTDYAYQIGHPIYPQPQPFNIRGASWSISYASDTYALATIWTQYTGYNKAGSSSSDTGYVYGGYGGQNDVPVYTTPYPVGNLDTISKFPFASSTTPATDVGELANAGYYAATGTPTEAFLFNALTPIGPPATAVIKFSYATETTQTSSFVSYPQTDRGTSVSSALAGYYAGGSPFPAATNTIHKFLFSNDSNGSDVGELVQGVYYNAPSSSTSSGYSLGGSYSPAVNTNSVNSIQSFPFSADAPATDVGEIGARIFNVATGAQV